MKNSEIEFPDIQWTFSRGVHGVYDEEKEAVYQKYGQNDSFRKTPRVHK